MALPHTERIVNRAIQGQIGVLGVTLQPALALQVTAHSARYRMRQLRKVFAGRRPDPTKPSCPIGTVNVHAIWEQHVKIDVEI